MKTQIMSFNGIDNVGIYGFITNKFALIASELDQKYVDKIKEVLGVSVYRLSIAGTPFLGAFIAGNEDKLIIPSIAFDDEIKALKNTKIDFEIVQTKFTCLGNNAIIGKKGIILNPEIEDVKANEISKIFNLPYKKEKLAELNSVGSIAVINGNKCLISSNVKEDKIKELEDFLGLEITSGTLNMGNHYIKTSILCNDNGFIIGKGTGGPELVNAQEALYERR